MCLPPTKVGMALARRPLGSSASAAIASAKTLPDLRQVARGGVRQRSKAPAHLLQFCMFDVVVPEAVLLSVSLPAASLQRSVMSLELVVEFVAFGSTGVVDAPEP